MSKLAKYACEIARETEARERGVPLCVSTDGYGVTMWLKGSREKLYMGWQQVWLALELNGKRRTKRFGLVKRAVAAGVALAALAIAQPQQPARRPKPMRKIEYNRPPAALAVWRMRTILVPELGPGECRVAPAGELEGRKRAALYVDEPREHVTWALEEIPDGRGAHKSSERMAAEEWRGMLGLEKR